VTRGRRRDFTGEIVAVIASLAPGEVVSYGDVAHDAGHPGAARAVGAVLAAGTVSAGSGTAGGAELPWWRVVRRDGRLVTADPDRQARLLRAEGVTVTCRAHRVIHSPAGRFARTASPPASATKGCQHDRSVM